jgi:hypothetical protein
VECQTGVDLEVLERKRERGNKAKFVWRSGFPVMEHKMDPKPGAVCRMKRLHKFPKRESVSLWNIFLGLCFHYGLRVSFQDGCGLLKSVAGPFW